MRKILLVSFWLVLSSQASYSDEHRQTQSSDIPLEGAGSLTIIYEGGADSGFSDGEKQLITDLIRRAEQEVRALLPTLPDVIEVTAMVIDRNVDIVGGVTGRADAPGKVLIEISSVFPGGITAAAQSALSSTVFHEFHHLNRGWTIQGNKFGPGIPIAAVNEGLATVFAEEYTGVYFAAAYSYPENAAEWLEEILALPGDADYSTWMMGEHPDGRNSIGYRVGRYIVHQATANSGKGILELSSLAPGEILRLAENAPSGGISL
jgi:uncharacterized protein YjaZ